jgi:dTDP-4-dehydrorhamnose reductase
MFRLGQKRSKLGVIADQVRSHPYMIDLAGSILDIIHSKPPAYGLDYYSNEGMTSWYDFARAVLALSRSPVRVNPLRTSDYVTRAVRPAYSVMDKAKLKQAFGLEVPYWRDSLRHCLAQLNEE